MELTFEELYKFVKATPEQIYELDGSYKEEYASLSKKVNNATFNNTDYIDIINKLRAANNENEIEEIRELFQIKFENKEDKKEMSEEETISEVYGISLDSIEHFRLKNGNEYYKFYDINQNKDFILEQSDKNKNLSEEFKEIQEQVLDTQKYSSQENAEEVFKYQRMHTNNEVALYSPHDLEINPDLLNDITKEEMKVVSVLLKNKEALHITVINPKLGIAIDENHKVISATYDEITKEYNITYPEEYTYSNNIEQVNKDGNIEGVEVSDDLPETIDEVEIDPEKVKFLYEYPEAMERKNVMSEKQKRAYIVAIEMYKKILQKRKEKTMKQPQKVYVKKYDYNKYRNAGFMNSILLALLTGFAGGVITMIVYNIIK